jgi:hypothetical protein
MRSLRWPSLGAMGMVVLGAGVSVWWPLKSIEVGVLPLLSVLDSRIRMSTNLRFADESTIVEVGSDASSGSQRIDLRMETPAILKTKLSF